MSIPRPRFDDAHRRLAAGEIPLSYRVASFRRILAAAAASRCPYSDDKIAQWAERFWWKYERAIDLGLNEPYPEAVRDIAYDVWGQWEMNLVNTYDIAQHKKLDRSQVRLPHEWYADWLARLNAVGV